MIYSKTMMKILAALLFVASLSVPARALNPKVIETDWTWKTYASSFTSVTSKTIDIAGYGTVGFSSTTPNITGFSFKFLPVGSSGTFTVSVTTKTYAPVVGSVFGFNNPSPTNLKGDRAYADIQTTSAMTIPAGTTMADAYVGTFEAQAINPVFKFTGLINTSTYYIFVEYGVPKNP